MTAVRTHDSLLVASWNVCRDGDGRRELLAELRPNLLFAQEVTAPAHRELLAATVDGQPLFDWGVLSLELDPDLGGTSHSERLGVGIYGYQVPDPLAKGIDPANPRPEKFVWARVQLPDVPDPLTVVSYHAAPGFPKPLSSLAAATWLAGTTGPVVAGMDTNSPGVDAVDHDESQFYWQQHPHQNHEASLIGSRTRRIHGLEDALRRYQDVVGLRLGDRGAVHDWADHPAPPGAPLAPSYNRNTSRGAPVLSRYDSIWVSPEVELVVDAAPVPVQYLWEGGTRVGRTGRYRPPGGSDHALVLAHVRPRVVDPRRPREWVVRHLRRCGAISDGMPVRFVQPPFSGPENDALAQATAQIDLSGVAWRNSGKELELVRQVRIGTTKLEPGRYSVADLAGAVHLAATGEGLPSHLAGPNWWRVDGLTLVELSDLGTRVENA